jgi:DNA-3-methyladenine glycosylase
MSTHAFCRCLEVEAYLGLSGPGRLCQALGITRAAHNGLDVTCADSPLQLLDDGYRPISLVATPVSE